MSKKTHLVAYCGLYCGDCPSYKGKIADLSRDLRKELRAAKFGKIAEVLGNDVSFLSEFRNYDTCYKVLGLMVKMRCKKTCRGGGGPPFCKVRKCCEKKGIEGCWECDEFETCRKLDFLKAVHHDSHIKNLRNIRKKGIKEFISGKRYW